jgi:hypothetical protein
MHVAFAELFMQLHTVHSLVVSSSGGGLRSTGQVGAHVQGPSPVAHQCPEPRQAVHAS